MKLDTANGVSREDLEGDQSESGFAIDVPVSRRELQARLTRQFRQQSATQLYDTSGSASSGIAIYSLSDPRELDAVRYVGQTKDPRRRFLQHLNTARLWLPDATPWWIKSPRLRPLSAWIRDLYRDEFRLPVMVVTSWVDFQHGRVAERARIIECLTLGRELLNVEKQVLGRQMTLV